MTVESEIEKSSTQAESDCTLSENAKRAFELNARSTLLESELRKEDSFLEKLMALLTSTKKPQ